MKKIITIAVIVFGTLSFALSQRKNADTSDQQTLMQLEREIANAYVQGDAKTLDRIFADELTNTAPGGFVSTKQQLLHVLRPLAGASFDLFGLNTHVYDKMAVVTGVMAFKGTDPNADEPAYLRFTDTFVKQQSGWRLIASQQQRVPPWMAHAFDSELKPLATQDCNQESSLRSLNYDVPTFIRFTNTRSGPVVIYWINYEGQRDPSEDQKETLAPGQSGVRQTFLTHPFLVTDASGRCLGIYQPAKEPSVAVIR